MKKSLNLIIFVIVLMVVALGSFWVTRAQVISGWQQENPIWLNDVPDEIVQTEEDFCQWMNQQKQTLMSQRLELAQLLEDPASTDELILAKVDQIGVIQAQLLRGVCEHLQSMGTVLPEAQQRLLRGFCRQNMQGASNCSDQDCQQHQGRQQRMGPGSGNGLRRGQRNGCCGLTRQLQLNDDQLALVQEKDPSFEEDVRELQTHLFTERQALRSLFESSQESNGQLTEQFDRLINAYNTLEKRLMNHVLIMRPYFTPDQQKQIIGLCQNKCSDGS